MPVVARADPTALTGVDPGYRSSYEQAVLRLEAAGCTVATIDLDPLLEAGRLLYQGGFLAERYAAVGAWIDAHPDDVDPVVGAIIGGARELPATRLAADTDRLGHLSAHVAALLDEAGVCSLVLPTVPFHPTLAQVAADPVGVNAQLGLFTNFVNLLDLCAVAVPSDPVDGLPCGVSLIGPAWSDRVQADLARLASTQAPADERAPDDDRALPALPAVPLAVAGAHLSGQPLNYQLTDRGGPSGAHHDHRPVYRLVALATEPPKPGLVRVADGAEGGAHRGGGVGAPAGRVLRLRGRPAPAHGHREGDPGRRLLRARLPLRAGGHGGGGRTSPRPGVGGPTWPAAEPAWRRTAQPVVAKRSANERVRDGHTTGSCPGTSW